MSQCAVHSCRNNTKRGKGITFHKFPVDPKACRRWITATGNGPEWKPSENSVICSAHFKSEDFMKNGNRKVLRRRAVPFSEDYEILREIEEEAAVDNIRFITIDTAGPVNDLEQESCTIETVYVENKEEAYGSPRPLQEYEDLREECAQLKEKLKKTEKELNGLKLALIDYSLKEKHKREINVRKILEKKDSFVKSSGHVTDSSTDSASEGESEPPRFGPDLNKESLLSLAAQIAAQFEDEYPDLMEQNSNVLDDHDYAQSSTCSLKTEFIRTIFRMDKVFNDMCGKGVRREEGVVSKLCAQMRKRVDCQSYGFDIIYGFALQRLLIRLDYLNRTLKRPSPKVTEPKSKRKKTKTTSCV